jgi:hypothetical protein
MAKKNTSPTTIITLELTSEQGDAAFIGYVTARRNKQAHVSRFEYFDETDLPVIIQDALTELETLTE